MYKNVHGNGLMQSADDRWKHVFFKGHFDNRVGGLQTLNLV